MYGHGSSVSSKSPDKQLIPCKNKINDTSDTQIKGKESIQELDNPSKSSKQDSIPDVEKKKPPPFKNKEDYIGDNNEKTRGPDDSPSETDVCVSNLGEEHKNQEVE